MLIYDLVISLTSRKAGNKVLCDDMILSLQMIHDIRNDYVEKA